MNWDLLFAIIFYGLLILFFLRNKSKIKMQGKILILYPTKLGLNFMDYVAKKIPRILRYTGYFGVAVGFLGMGYIFWILANGAFEVLFVPDAMPLVAPVLPGVQTLPGTPVISFWHWIIVILIVATIHEFSHGVIARTFKINVLSSGFALLGPLLAAFVEPDEKQLAKSRDIEKLSIFAAGPFSNILTGLLVLGLMAFAIGPAYFAMIEPYGVVANEVIEGYPAYEAGMTAPIELRSINNAEIKGLTGFSEELSRLIPGETVMINTDKGRYLVKTIENPQNESKGFIGVANFEQKERVKIGIPEFLKEKIPPAFRWFNTLLMWLGIVSIGIGIFNLAPGPLVDGGKMLLIGAYFIFRNEGRAKKTYAIVAMTTLILLLINLWPWVMKLIVWLFKPVLLLVGLV